MAKTKIGSLEGSIYVIRTVSMNMSEWADLGAIIPLRKYSLLGNQAGILHNHGQ